MAGFFHNHRLCGFEMSSPDRDVSDFPNLEMSVRWVGRRAGAEPLRSAAPDQRSIDWSSQPHPFFYRARASSLGS